MANIYERRRLWKIAFLAVSLVLVAVFLQVSNNLVKDLSQQERDRMEIWAKATKELATAPVYDPMPLDSLGTNYMAMPSSDIDFFLGIIEDNRNIPVLLVDDYDNILQYRNFRLPEPVDSLMPYVLSERNQAFLQHKLEDLKGTKNHIVINIDEQTTQHLYYEDSTSLKQISYFPYIQLGVMILFVAIVYFAVVSTKKAEQNKVWVGLSKETAHQLGTPISSLMAWVQMLEATGVDKEIVDDMDKDVHRLSVIADRFSKIGSKPEMELAFICESVTKGLEYMRARISSNVALNIYLPDDDKGVRLCQPLFEWGKGIARQNFKTVFNPGFTSKKRGWGLGLTLAKRIIEEYHSGKIYVKSSELNVGTTFRIELPLVKEE